MKNISQKDIAIALGVSRVTVTKALKDHPDIAEKTRKKIQRKATEMGYIPNFIGRSLSSGQTFTIGVVLPKVAHSFFSASIEFFYRFANEKGYNIIPMISFEDSGKEFKNILTLLSMRVDGIIIDVASNITSNDLNYQIIKNNGTRFLFFDRYPANHSGPAVAGEDYHAAKAITNLLIHKGYKKILHLCGPPGLNISSDRKKGYEDAMREAGNISQVHNVNLVTESGYSEMKKLLDSGVIPEAVFCVNDSVAHGVYQAAKEKGITIPRDLAVAGFGDLESSGLLNPPLTTVRLPVEEMTRMAVDKIIEMIENKIPLSDKWTFHYTLIERESI